MIKNTAGQKVGVQMVAAADGSAFTGSVTVAVTLDAGTQATGTVGSGACTHEGNGYHTYAPSQAETNGDLAAFTFTGTAAVPQTVQVYTRASAPDVNVTQLNSSSANLLNLAASASAIYRGTVGSSPTTTTVTDASLTQTTNDHWKGRIIIFTSGALAGQASDITGFNATTDTLTFTALTSAPSVSDTYVIV